MNEYYVTSKFCGFLERCLVDFGVDAVTGCPMTPSVTVSLLSAAAELRPTDLERGLSCLGCSSVVLRAVAVDVFMLSLIHI